jgi:hypothetical protein
MQERDSQEPNQTGFFKSGYERLTLIFSSGFCGISFIPFIPAQIAFVTIKPLSDRDKGDEQDRIQAQKLIVSSNEQC